MADKIPHNPEAERYVLGSILLDDSQFAKLADWIGEEDLHLEKHRLIFRRMTMLHERGEKIDRVTVAQELMRFEELEKCDGLSYLVSLDEGLPQILNIESYARMVRECSALRRLLFSCHNFTGRACDPGAQAADLLREASDRFASLEVDFHRQARNALNPMQILEGFEGGVRGFFEYAEKPGIPTGFPALDDCLNGLQSGCQYVIGGITGSGKAQPLDSLVKVPGGWKRMGDLQVGDRLDSPDGSPSVVTGVFPRGELDVVRLVASDGRSTECSLDHLWKFEIYTGAKRTEVSPASHIGELLKTKALSSRIGLPQVSGDFGHRRELPLDPWVLGYIIGNGCLRDGTPLVSIPDECTKQRMAEEVSKIGYKLTTNNGLDFRICTSGSRWKKGVRGVPKNAIAKVLGNLGLSGSLSYEKFIPRDYLYADRGRREELLRGLMDSDGTVGAAGGVTFDTSSPCLARDAAELIRSLGYCCKVSSRKTNYPGQDGKKRQGRDSYRLSISGGDPARLFWLPRKLSRCQGRSFRKRLRVLRLDAAGKKECRCISVSHPQGLYITDGYLVTHNTSLAMDISRNIADSGVPVGVFSLEMTKEQLLTRLICNEAEVSLKAFRKKDLVEAERLRIMRATSKISNLPLFIDDSDGLSANEIIRRISRMVREMGIRAAVVDYLQIVNWRNVKGAKFVSEYDANTYASFAFKINCAKRHKISTVVLSQLKRGEGMRKAKSGDSKPELSDLKSTGGIENDADAVLFAHRAEMFRPGDPELREKAEIIVAKNRHGERKTIKVRFKSRFVKFLPLPEGEDD